MLPVRVEGTASPADLAVELAAGLEGFYVKAMERFVVIAHPSLGMAAVVPSDDEVTAMSAAAELNAIAQSAGVAYPSMHFAVSRRGAKPPWVIRGAAMPIDIMSAMVQALRTRPPFEADAMGKIVAALDARPASAIPEKPKTLSPGFVRMAEACVEKAVGGRVIQVAGVDIQPADVAGPRFLLPAVLLATAQDWAVPVVGAKGEGGFVLSLTADPGAILDYRVSGIRTSAPLLLFLPMVNLIRRSIRGDMCVLDDAVESYVRFLSRHGFDSGAMEDVEVKVITAA